MSIKNRLKSEIFKLISCTSITAKAEQVNESEPPVANQEPPVSKPSSEPTINMEDLTAKARKEEKDKLYPRINKLEADLEAMTKSNNANLLKVATLEKQLNDQESEAMTDLKKEVETLQKKLDKAEKASTTEENLRAEIEKEYEVKFYKSEKLNELKDSILPTFIDLVDGKTVEEIDSSIEVATAKTLETKKLLGLVDEEGNAITKKEANPETPPSKPSLMNPSNTQLAEVFNAQQVRDMSLDEYAEWRKNQTGLK